jgi:ferrochelatase
MSGAATTGILLANLGTPDAPTTGALRRFLREFLSDPRVIELPRWKWWPILNLFVLRTRPDRSAKGYKRIWTEEGSPLLAIGRRQAEGLRSRLGGTIPVALGMRYGNPSMQSAVDELQKAGCRRVLLFPLYPQYSATTTASTFDAATDVLRKLRWVPELRTIHGYSDEPLYIRALANSVREHWQKEGQPDRLLISFHGIPRRYFMQGDPYPIECGRTASLLAKELELEEDRWLLAFQSRFGREEGVTPYTDETLAAWAREGLGSVDVICPGFAADCLETIDEIGFENRELFSKSGGGRYRYIPALNDRPDHLTALLDVAKRQLQGWV